MDHQGLYKVSSNFGNNNTRLKSYQNRCDEKRAALYHSRRPITESPIIAVKEKEIVEEKGNLTVKARKQEAFLAKYLAWKQEKNKRKNEEKMNKKKPFFVAVSTKGSNSNQKSFASENHKFVTKNIVSVQKNPEKATILKVKNGINTNIVHSTVPKKHITNNNIVKNTIMRPPPPPPAKKKSPVKLKKISSIATTFGNELNNNNKPKLKPIKPNLLKSKSQPIFKKNQENKLSSVGSKQTPNENPNHPFKSIFTSTQRKQSVNTNIKTTDELTESIISPIDFIDNNNDDDKFLIDLNITQDNNCWPSPIKQGNSLLTSTLKLNYLSPFVSTSRGKVNAKKEKEKRDSIYLIEKSSPEEESITVRRIREAVRRFNKLLNDETERLENICNIWHKYITDNIDSLNENGGVDMINATLGQTKLLITKKLKQFGDLIEKCSNDGMENKNNKNGEKLIYPEDLEGFWSMINIQIDDIDKRYNNLNKWKENNWIDPDEPPKIKKLSSLSIVAGKRRKKNTIKSSHQMQNYLKKLISEGKKNKMKNKQNDNEDVIIVTKRRSSNIRRSINNSNQENTSLRRSSRRISKVPAPSISPENKENVNNTPIRRTSRRLKPPRTGSMVLSPKNNEIENITTPLRNRRSEWRCINLLKSVSNDVLLTPLQQPPRKSILKTPGTLKKNHNVIFNEKLQFKSPEQQSKVRKSSNELFRKNSIEKQYSNTKINFSAEKKRGKRSLSLRTRKLLMDPDFKTEVPHEQQGFVLK